MVHARGETTLLDKSITIVLTLELAVDLRRVDLVRIPKSY